MKKSYKFGLAAVAVAASMTALAADVETEAETESEYEAIGWTPIALGIASPVRDYAVGTLLTDPAERGVLVLANYSSIALMQEWAATDMREPPEKVAKLLECATNSSLNGMMAYSAEQ